MTVVSAPLDICHTVPETSGFANTYGGYKVTCSADGQSGALQFCDTNKCGVCNTTTFQQYRCLPTDARFGSSSVSVDCFAQNEMRRAAGSTPPAQFFSATWFAEEQCRQGQCPQGFYTVVEGRQDIWWVVWQSDRGTQKIVMLY